VIIGLAALAEDANHLADILECVHYPAARRSRQGPQGKGDVFRLRSSCSRWFWSYPRASRLNYTPRKE